MSAHMFLLSNSHVLAIQICCSKDVDPGHVHGLVHACDCSGLAS